MFTVYTEDLDHFCNSYLTQEPFSYEKFCFLLECLDTYLEHFHLKPNLNYFFNFLVKNKTEALSFRSVKLRNFRKFNIMKTGWVLVVREWNFYCIIFVWSWIIIIFINITCRTQESQIFFKSMTAWKSLTRLFHQRNLNSNISWTHLHFTFHKFLQQVKD